MDRNTDSEVIHAAVDWLQQSETVYLVTVVRTWGSAPRRPGALMLIHQDGRFIGSVSGGCVEDDLVQRVLRGEFEQQAPQLIDYGVSGRQTRKIGLPCGGQLQLLVEYLDSAGPLQKIGQMLDAGKRIVRRVCLATSECSLHPARDSRSFSFDGDNLYRTFGPDWRMLIIGAGELARRVSQLALTLDYAVTVCDSRAEYADGWQLDGVVFDHRPVETCMQQFAADAHSAILALAHAPPLDDPALLAALDSDAFYIGALGSKKNHSTRLQRLQNLGVSDVQLQRLHGPVGLDIGSHTPAEIAIAIIAELVQVRNHQQLEKTVVEVANG